MDGQSLLNVICGSATVLGLSDKNVNDTVWRATVLGWINLVNKDISNRQQNFHWRWLEKTVTAPTAIGQHSYDKPIDMYMNKMFSVYDRTNNRTYIFKPYDEFVNLIPNPSLSSGSPGWHTLFAGTIRLYPIPASIFTFFMDYGRRISSISDNATTIDIPDNYEDVVINGAMIYIYKFDPDMGDWKAQQQIYEAGIDRMIRDNNMSPSEKSQPQSHRNKRQGRVFPI
uniref:Uncharacterized protein n=1 Tax=viral metagenome TaxID=1070528 RepID=A0A6M3KPE7_9ZZZZ